MALSYVPIFPNEMSDRISEELSGIDLFHFTLINEWYLATSTHYLIRLFRLKSRFVLDKQVRLLLNMLNSLYTMVENGISVLLSPYKWNSFVYGAFKLEVIEKSLKYYSTTMSFLYCRLWSFNPFYYEASYPTLDIFKFPRMIVVYIL